MQETGEVDFGTTSQAALQTACSQRAGFPSYNLSVGLTPASSPGRGATGEEVKFTECQGLSYQERCHRR